MCATLQHYYRGMCTLLKGKHASDSHVVFELLRFKGYVIKGGLASSDAESLRTIVKRLVALFDRLTIFYASMLKGVLLEKKSLAAENARLKHRIAQLEQAMDITAATTLMKIHQRCKC